jgi:actin-related protein
MTDINVLVLDNGSESIKASYCIPERDPLLVTPSAVKAGDGSTLRPIRRGVVQDWDALESIYHHIFYEQARGRGPHEKARRPL